MIRSRIGSPIASAAVHPKIRSAAAFQLRIDALGVERDERVRRAVEHQPRARLALAQLAPARSDSARPARSRSSMREISSPATSGVPTPSSQRIAGLGGVAEREHDRVARRRCTPGERAPAPVLKK